MKSISEIRQALAQCYCSEHYHKFNLLYPNILISDGAKTVADMCEAYWLMELIASYQPKCQKDEMLRYHQFWTLKREGAGWLAVCERDTNDVFLTQNIEYSDFPLPEGIKLYVGPVDERRFLIFLPSEY